MKDGWVTKEEMAWLRLGWDLLIFGNGFCEQKVVDGVMLYRRVAPDVVTLEDLGLDEEANDA